MNPRTSKPISPALAALLDGLRRRIRSYVWLEGLAAVLVLLGAAFWFSLGFDWVFEPPAPLRIALISAVAIGVLWLLYRLILRRAFVRLADRSMALLLERRFRSLDDSLITVVELAEHEHPAEEFNPEMMAVTERDALAGIDKVKLGAVLNMQPLYRRIATAALLIGSVVGFGVLATDAFGIWARRSLMLSDELWPRQTRLTVVGFDETRSIKVARGSDVELVAQADAAPGRMIPELVQVRFATADGGKVRENMSRQGQAVPGRDSFQTYHYKFKGVLTPIEFYVYGGDDRRGPYRLEVVDSPTITQMTLHCEYPAYTHRSPRDIPVSGIMPIPVGTKIIINALANKDLRGVQVDEVLDGTSPVSDRITVSEDSQTPRQFEFVIDQFKTDATLLFTLFDSDGLKSRDPIRLSLTAVPDEAPQVAARLTGIGTAITPKARLPLSGEITDDYAIGRAWFELKVDDGTSKEQPFVTDPAGRDKLQVAEAIEVGPFDLKPKQKLHLVANAADTYDLAEKPNVGTSQKYVLDIVTAEQLRSMLESRELQLRRRFETIYQEFNDTRDLLARIDLNEAKPRDDAPEKPANNQKQPGEHPAGYEPGDEPGDRSREVAETESAEQMASKRRVQAARVTQNSSRAADEIRGLAVAFEEIRAELVNNRVDTEELKERLQEGISVPLRQIADQRFPELLERLKTLESSLDKPAEAGPAQDAARAQADLILVEMKQVLDKMLELETFNEALDLLRAIIKSQDELNQETKQRQKSKVLELLEEDD
jgi:hypothetical protein